MKTLIQLGKLLWKWQAINKLTNEQIEKQNLTNKPIGKLENWQIGKQLGKMETCLKFIRKGSLGWEIWFKVLSGTG